MAICCGTGVLLLQRVVITGRKAVGAASIRLSLSVPHSHSVARNWASRIKELFQQDNIGAVLFKSTVLTSESMQHIFRIFFS